MREREKARLTWQKSLGGTLPSAVFLGGGCCQWNCGAVGHSPKKKSQNDFRYIKDNQRYIFRQTGIGACRAAAHSDQSRSGLEFLSREVYTKIPTKTWDPRNFYRKKLGKL